MLSLLYYCKTRFLLGLLKVEASKLDFVLTGTAQLKENVCGNTLRMSKFLCLHTSLSLRSK